MDASNINSFQNHLQKFEKQESVFRGSPLNPMSLACRLTAVEATKGNEHKVKIRVRSSSYALTLINLNSVVIKPVIGWRTFPDLRLMYG